MSLRCQASSVAGVHDGSQFLKHPPAQFLGSDSQASALIIVETQPLACELFAKNTVLFVKIFDDVLLLLI